MADDPTKDRAEYDESVEVARCPECGGPLMFNEDSSSWFNGQEEGFRWWCPSCESWSKDDELKKLKLDHRRQSRRR